MAKILPYRAAGEPGLVIERLRPRGLVRANGSRCTCSPPGLIWCWWVGVQTEDRWYCKHGGGWKRRYKSLPLIFNHYWDALPAPPEGDE